MSERKQHPSFEDLTGQRFGKLVVLGRGGYGEKDRLLWSCQCDCGNTTTATTTKLKHGKKKSCGCILGRGRSLEERFWARVDKNGPMREDLGSQCWVWTGHLNMYGYGQTRSQDGKTKLCHRLSLEMAGVDLEGLQALHKCDNPACVRPDHLYAGKDVANRYDIRDRSGSKAYRLNAEIVAELRKTVPGQMSESEAAAKYGVSKATIHYAVVGRTWGPRTDEPRVLERVTKADLAAKIERLEDALSFYAECGNDQGERARKAIGE